LFEGIYSDFFVLPRPFLQAIAALYSQKKKRRQNKKSAVKTEKENSLTASD
jgi:hypothetical protein